jgi:Rrf2 family iron-sulfur cluster assembly transcriptional regulator
MRLTTKGRYGVRAVVNLAASYANRPISIKTIATEEDVSPEFLEQIFFKLKKAGLIASIRGPGGGFVLKKKASEIAVKDILDAVGEFVRPAPCTTEEIGCDREDRCKMATTWQELSRLIDEYLESVTIASILEKAGAKYYEKIDADQNFAI